MHSINSVYVSISMSRSILPLLSPSVSRCLFLCLCLYFCFVNKIIYTNFFRFYIYALAYNIYLSPSDLRSVSYLSLASQVAVVVENPPASAEDMRDAVSIPGLGRPPGEAHGNLLQYSCLENPMDTVHEVTKSWTRLGDSTARLEGT